MANITTEHPAFKAKRKAMAPKSRNNGCYYYAKEIEKFIIPAVETKRSWNSLTINECGAEDGMICFIHNNATPWAYRWLEKYDDLILVCSNQNTIPFVQHLGKTIYLPLSVDTEYVAKFKADKIPGSIAMVGNTWTSEMLRTRIDPAAERLGRGMARTTLLKELAKREKVYAVGRCAIEALVLGCELLPTETRTTSNQYTEILDSRDAAKILQTKLKEIGG